MHMYILQSLQINYRNIIVKAEKLLFKVPRFYFEKKKKSTGSAHSISGDSICDRKNRQECYPRGDIRLPVGGSLDSLLNLIGGSMGGIETVHLKINRTSEAVCGLKL